MKYFFDTEFHEDGRIIDLISIGIVAEDGREYYGVSSDFAPHYCNDWVKEHVLPKLPSQETPEGLKLWKTRAEIHDEILKFVDEDTSAPEFWAYFADYDWVVFCQLFGRMVDLPKGWPMYCRDLKQVIDLNHVPRRALPPEPENAHHALADARWARDTYLSLRKELFDIGWGD